jgi:hypothetical protein
MEGQHLEEYVGPEQHLEDTHLMTLQDTPPRVQGRSKGGELATIAVTKVILLRIVSLTERRQRWRMEGQHLEEYVGPEQHMYNNVWLDPRPTLGPM